jgi:hypothetical protein
MAEVPGTRDSDLNRTGEEQMKKQGVVFGVLAAGLVVALLACSSDEGGGGEGDEQGGGSLPSGYQVLAENDANGDGVLSADEAPSDIQASFDRLDTNGDGVLTSSEIDQAGQSASSGAASSVIDTATQGAAAAADTASAMSGEICAEANATPTRMAPKVVLLLDGSSSMREAYGNTDRWTAMRQALVDPTNGVVKTMEGLIEFGLVIFAGEYRNGGGDCPIPGEVVGPALNNYSAIEAAFPVEQPGRYTPTGEALQLVCEALPGVEADQRPQYVILATDGEPNSCEGMVAGGVDYQSVIDAANLCCEKGVIIYVVSLASGGPEYEDHLQEVANIGACGSSPGGAASVYSPQDPGQLSTDLGELIGGAVTCDVLLDGSVVQGKECEGSVVTLNGRVLGCNDPDGWILVSENVIRLQGQACYEFTEIPTSVLTATFPCEVFIPGGGGPGGGSGGPGDGAAGSGSGGGAAGSGSGGPSGLEPIF